MKLSSLASALFIVSNAVSAAEVSSSSRNLRNDINAPHSDDGRGLNGNPFTESTPGNGNGNGPPDLDKFKEEKMLSPDADVTIVEDIADGCFTLGSSNQIRCIADMEEQDSSITFTTESGASVVAPSLYKASDDDTDVTVISNSNDISYIVERTASGDKIVTENVGGTYVKYNPKQVNKAALSKYQYGEAVVPDTDEGRFLAKIDNEVHRRVEVTIPPPSSSSSPKYINVEVQFDVSHDAFDHFGGTIQAVSALTFMMDEVMSDFSFAGVRIVPHVSIDDIGTSAFTNMVASNNEVCSGGNNLLDDFRSGLSNNKALRHGIWSKGMNGSTIGCAYLGVVCNSAYGSGVSQLYSSNQYQNAMVVSHELVSIDVLSVKYCTPSRDSNIQPHSTTKPNRATTLMRSTIAQQQQTSCTLVRVMKIIFGHQLGQLRCTSMPGVSYRAFM